MSSSPALRPPVCLHNLAPELDQELSSVLRELSVDVVPAEQASLAFCEPDSLAATLRSHPGLPVIVVSPHSNVTEWLDALDGGAADYCSAPFELAHLGWILSSRQRPLAAAAA